MSSKKDPGDLLHNPASSSRSFEAQKVHTERFGQSHPIFNPYKIKTQDAKCSFLQTMDSGCTQKQLQNWLRTLLAQNP